MAAIKPQERRRFPRLADGIKVIYKFMGIAGEKKKAVQDVSQGGIRLLFAEKAKPGTVLELGLFLPHETTPFFVLGRVAWQIDKPRAAEDNKKYYETGIEFMNIDIEHKMLLIQYIYGRIKKGEAHL